MGKAEKLEFRSWKLEFHATCRQAMSCAWANRERTGALTKNKGVLRVLTGNGARPPRWGWRSMRSRRAKNSSLRWSYPNPEGKGPVRAAHQVADGELPLGWRRQSIGIPSKSTRQHAKLLCGLTPAPTGCFLTLGFAVPERGPVWIFPPHYFSPLARRVWKCGGCSSVATMLISIFLKPASSSQRCRSPSAKPGQRSP